MLLNFAFALGGLAVELFGERGEVFADLSGVDGARVERAAPFDEFVMALVFRVGDRAQILLVSRRSPDIFGRAAALCIDEPGIGCAGLGTVMVSILIVCFQPSPKS